MNNTFLPATKAARHALITQLLGQYRISSQTDLKDVLSQHGVLTTQATLSRDLVELRATKVRSSTGRSFYRIPEAGAPGQVMDPIVDDEPIEEVRPSRLQRWCADLLVTAVHAGSQVVLRTPPGAAQLLAAALDDAMIPGVMGCIAGDDTVLVLTRTEKIAAQVVEHVLSLAAHDRHSSSRVAGGLAATVEENLTVDDDDEGVVYASEHDLRS